jgi:serine/threonine protein kinase
MLACSCFTEFVSNRVGYTIKGDVYSFGTIVLEMISGRSPQSLEAGQSLAQWIRHTVSVSKTLQDILDPRLMSELRDKEQTMAMVLGVALLCTREDPSERPYIADVLRMLNHVKTRPQSAPQETAAAKNFQWP